MNSWVIIFLLTFIILMIANFYFMKQGDKRELRVIPAFETMHSSMETSVEDGSRIHFAIGRSEVTSPEIAAGIIGLNLLKRVGYITSDSDLAPISSAGTGALMLLSQDTIRTICREIGQKGDLSSQMGHFTGPTPFSYAAGSALTISGKEVSTNLMIGSFGVEAGLLIHAGDSSKTLTVAGTDDIIGQAVIYTTAYDPLIGEEVFAAGAYFGAKDMHRASLFTQDLMRILIIIGISAISIYSLIRGLLQ